MISAPTGIAASRTDSTLTSVFEKSSEQNPAISPTVKELARIALEGAAERMGDSGSESLPPKGSDPHDADAVTGETHSDAGAVDLDAARRLVDDIHGEMALATPPDQANH